MVTSIISLILVGQVLDITSTIITLRMNSNLQEGNPFTKNLYLLSGMKLVFSVLMILLALYLPSPLGILLALVLFCTGLFLAVHNFLMI